MRALALIASGLFACAPDFDPLDDALYACASGAECASGERCLAVGPKEAVCQGEGETLLFLDVPQGEDVVDPTTGLRWRSGLVVEDDTPAVNQLEAEARCKRLPAPGAGLSWRLPGPAELATLFSGCANVVRDVDVCRLFGSGCSDPTCLASCQTAVALATCDGGAQCPARREIPAGPCGDYWTGLSVPQEPDRGVIARFAGASVGLFTANRANDTALVFCVSDAP